MHIADDATGSVARFYLHTVPNEAKTAKEGRPIFDEMEVCEIKFAANKQTVGVYPAHDIADWHLDPSTGEKAPITYAMKYNSLYLAFKNGEQQVMGGTPLEALPFLTPAKRMELKALNIHTAETLAGLDGQPLKQLGMGGRDLKNQAQTYLDDSAKHAPETALAAVVAQQDAQIAELRAQIAEMQGKPANGTRDPLDHDGDGKKGGAAPKLPSVAELLAMADDKEVHFKTFSAEAKRVLGDDMPSTKADIVAALTARQEEATASPFADFEDDDIRNWLKDAAPDLDTSDFNREALIEAADEANRLLAQKESK